MIFRRITLPSPYQPSGKLRVFDENLVKSLEALTNTLTAMFDKGVNVNDNMDVEILTVTTDATPDTESSHAHTLKRVPTGYLVASKDKAGIIYDGSTTNTTTTLYLRSDTASVTAKVIVF